MRHSCLTLLLATLVRRSHLVPLTWHFEAKTEHFEAKIGNLEAKIGHFETKIDHFEAKTDHFEAKIDHFEAKIDHFEAQNVKNVKNARFGGQVFQNDRPKFLVKFFIWA